MPVLCHESPPLPGRPAGGPRVIMPVASGSPRQPPATRRRSSSQHCVYRAPGRVEGAWLCWPRPAGAARSCWARLTVLAASGQWRRGWPRPSRAPRGVSARPFRP